jgi:hypothetical protein
MLKFCIALFGLSMSICAQRIPSIAGTWEGFFNGQPQKLLADGSYPEPRTKFKLHLQFSQGAKLVGTLTVLEPSGHISQIKNSRCDRDGCSFEVLNYGEETEITSWRIWTENGELSGMRNFGPLRPFGLGTGARIFGIKAKRIYSK